MATSFQAWACTQCTFENPAGSGQCEMCGQMRLVEPRPTFGPTGGDALTSAVAWSCQQCTFKNPAGSISCDMCGQEHVNSALPATGGGNYTVVSSSAAGSDGLSSSLVWTCMQCSFENPSSSISCEMCAQVRIDTTPSTMSGSISTAALSSTERKRREIIERQLANKSVIDAEVVAHFKAEEQDRGLVTEPFECSCCFDDVESGILCAPGHAECDHKICSPCLARLAEGQIERKEALVCPLCPASRPAQIPSWLVGLVVSADAQARLVEIEQLHLNQVGGGTLRLWQCPTPDCSNRLALDSDWDARIAAKRCAFGIGVADRPQVSRPRGTARGAARRAARRVAPEAAQGRARSPVGAAPAVGKKVRDEAFRASSQRDTNCAYSARLHDPAGWLPFGEENGWLEIDLGEDVRLVGLAIQGGFFGSVSIRPSGSGAAEWIPGAYIVPQAANLEHIVDYEFPPVVARFLRFDAEEFVGESGLRFEVYSTDAPDGVAPLTEQERVVACTACSKKICVRCMVEEHAGFTCDAFARWKEENETGERAYADMVAQGLIKPCPNCAAPILKNEGCNFMSCPTCNDENRMCWETGKKRYGPDGCGGGHNCH